MGTYQKEYFRGGSNENINLITCDSINIITSIFQS